MKKQINKCLSGKWIGLIGDSVMKDFAQILVEKQGWIVNETTMAPYYAQKTVYRYFDTIFDSSIDIGARISFMWNGAPAPQGNGYGLYSYEAEEYVQRTKLFFNHRCSTCQNDDPNKPFPTSEEGHKPDIMVVNSGLHDLYNLVNVLEFHFDIYEEKLRKFLMFVQPLAHKIIWKATSPKVSYFICTGNQIPNNGDAAVDVLNQIARRVVAEFPSIDYFDSNTIQKSRPEDSDGHHCKENPSCQEGFHVFMNMICPQNE